MIIALSGKKQSGKNTVALIIEYLVHNERAFASKQAILRPFEQIYAKPEWVQTLKENPIWEQKSFAHELKVFISKIANIPMEWFEDEEKKNMLMPEEWIRYGYADGFIHKGKAGDVVMNYKACDKEMYEIQKSINWQTAYKHHPTLREMMTGIGTDALRNWHSNIWVNALFSTYPPQSVLDDLNRDGGNPVVSAPNWIVTDCRFPNELQACQDRKAVTIRIEREGIPLSDHPSETSLDDADFDYVIWNGGTLEKLVDEVKMVLQNEKII